MKLTSHSMAVIVSTCRLKTPKVQIECLAGK